MRRIFTSTIFVAALAVASFNSFGQQCSTTQPNTSVCSSTVAASFNSGNQSGWGATNGDFTYTSSSFYQADKGNNLTGATAVITSPSFVKSTTTPNSVQVGFLLTLGNKVTVTGLKVDVLDANTSTVLATCSQTGLAITNSNDGTQCFGVTSPAIIPGNLIKYRFTVTFNTSTGSGTNIIFDDFSYGGNSNAALPVKFQTLDAKAVNAGVSLNWNIASEQDLNGYSIERSADGRNFSQIAFVGANGQSNYSFVDSKPTATAYYRIKSVDINGRYGYSTVALVKSGKSTIVLKAFPSPVIKSVSIQHPTAIAGTSISISSADGRIMKTIIPAAGMQQTEIDLSAAKAGLYLVRFNSGNGESETLKILKQ